MKAALVAAIARAADGPREFAAGWIEGRNRYQRAAGGEIPPSWFDPRTTGRAASQAALAFYLSLDGMDVL